MKTFLIVLTGLFFATACSGQKQNPPTNYEITIPVEFESYSAEFTKKLKPQCLAFLKKNELYSPAFSEFRKYNYENFTLWTVELRSNDKESNTILSYNLLVLVRGDKISFALTGSNAAGTTPVLCLKHNDDYLLITQTSFWHQTFSIEFCIIDKNFALRKIASIPNYDSAKGAIYEIKNTTIWINLIPKYPSLNNDELAKNSEFIIASKALGKYFPLSIELKNKPATKK